MIEGVRLKLVGMTIADRHEPPAIRYEQLCFGTLSAMYYNIDK